MKISRVMDFNPRMRRIFVSAGGIPEKQYMTYRYLFDRRKEFRLHLIPDIRV
jgi:hypothetical protein